MIAMESSSILQKVLNVNLLPEYADDIKIVKLRKIEFKYTVEDKPYIRMSLGDIYGKTVVGRMFNVEDLKGIGSTLENFVGSYLYIGFSTQKSPRDTGITVNSIEALKDEAIQELEESLAEMYTARFCNTWNSFVSVLKTSEVLVDESQLSQWSILRTYSDENICAGTPSSICTVLSSTVLSARCAGVPAQVLNTFIDVVVEWCKSNQQSYTLANLRQASFYTSVMNTIQPSHSPESTRAIMLDLADFAALFMDNSKVFSPATKLVYDLYQSFLKFYSLKELSSDIPNNGFITHSGEIIRK